MQSLLHTEFARATAHEKAERWQTPAGRGIVARRRSGYRSRLAHAASSLRGLRSARCARATDPVWTDVS